METDKIMELSRKNWEAQLDLGRKIDKHIAAVIHGRNFGKTKWIQEQLRKNIKKLFEPHPDGILYMQCSCKFVNIIRKKDLGDLDNPEYHCKECGRRLI